MLPYNQVSVYQWEVFICRWKYRTIPTAPTPYHGVSHGTWKCRYWKKLGVSTGSSISYSRIVTSYLVTCAQPDLKAWAGHWNLCRKVVKSEVNEWTLDSILRTKHLRCQNTLSFPSGIHFHDLVGRVYVSRLDGNKTLYSFDFNCLHWTVHVLESRMFSLSVLSFDPVTRKEVCRD